MDLCNLTLTEAAELIEKRELSPLVLTRAYLDRIASIDEHLNCFITLDERGALQAAQNAQKRRSRKVTIAGHCTGFRSL